MAQSHREATRNLFEIADQQQGFFTTKQAKADYLAQVRESLHAAFRAAGYPTKYHRSTRADRALDHTSVA